MARRAWRGRRVNLFGPQVVRGDTWGLSLRVWRADRAVRWWRRCSPAVTAAAAACGGSSDLRSCDEKGFTGAIADGSPGVLGTPVEATRDVFGPGGIYFPAGPVQEEDRVDVTGPGPVVEVSRGDDLILRVAWTTARDGGWIAPSGIMVLARYVWMALVAGRPPGCGGLWGRCRHTTALPRLRRHPCR